MSTIDFNSLSRSAHLALQPGLRAAPACNLPQESPHGVPAPHTVAVPHTPDALRESISDVAKLHTEAERSMSTGLSSAVQRAVDRPTPTHSASNNQTPNQAAAASVPAVNSAQAEPVAVAKGPSLHRVREVRREQGVSIKRASQHLGCSVDEARRQEEPTTDLTLTQLQAWQKLCEVPVADLLVEPDCELSAPVLQRARMVRVMKTVQAIMERTGQTSVKRLGQTLVNQLVELMPELKGVSSWHAVERRQSCNQNARILESNYLRPAEEDDRE